MKREADGLKPIHSDQTSEPDRGNQVKKSLPAHSPQLGLRGLRGQSSAVHPEQDTEGTRPSGQKSPPSPCRHSALSPDRATEPHKPPTGDAAGARGRVHTEEKRKWPEALSGHVSNTGRTEPSSSSGPALPRCPPPRRPCPCLQPTTGSQGVGSGSPQTAEKEPDGNHSLCKSLSAHGQEPQSL